MTEKSSKIPTQHDDDDDGMRKSGGITPKNGCMGVSIDLSPSLMEQPHCLHLRRTSKQAINQASEQAEGSSLEKPIEAMQKDQRKKTKEKKKKRNSLPVKPLYFSDSLWVISSRQSRR